MGTRLELHHILTDILQSNNVYYQPPATIKLKFPAIIYSLDRILERHASDKTYKRDNSYSLIYISTKPDDPTVEKLMELPYCKFDRHYAIDNLHHTALTLYY